MACGILYELVEYSTLISYTQVPSTCAKVHLRLYRVPLPKPDTFQSLAC